MELQDNNIERASDYQHNKYYLQRQNCGHAIQEVPVSCLMTEYMHSQYGSYASTDNSDCKESRFWYAKCALDGLFLVYAHKCKAYKVDNQDIPGQG